MRMTLTLLTLTLLLLTGCALHRRVTAYNQRATVECRKTHTEQECRPLTYPTCLHTGEACQ